MLGEAASLCMNATESLKHCSDEMFLCSVGRSFHPWDRNGWRAHLESALHAREKMQPAGAAISTRRNGVLCFRKIGDIVAKMKDDVCAPDKQTVVLCSSAVEGLVLCRPVIACCGLRVPVLTSPPSCVQVK